MTNICTKNHAGNSGAIPSYSKHTSLKMPISRFLLVCLSILTFSMSSYGQMGTMEVDNSISSGIITAIDSTNETGIVQFEFENISKLDAKTIYFEYMKYEGYIVNYGIKGNRLIVAYVSPHYPNFLLGILDRVNIRGYYLVNGNPTYYFKDGQASFVR